MSVTCLEEQNRLLTTWTVWFRSVSGLLAFAAR
jgi:hypothetical protein